MTLNMYAVFDDLATSYQFFGCFVNDAVARRSFDISISGEGVPGSDLSLYRVGAFDTVTGKLETDFDFLKRGESK